jgi:hypothetical protein
LHPFLQQTDGLGAVVKDPSRAIATVQKRALRLGQEDSNAGSADRTLRGSDLAERGFENEFIRWFVDRVSLVLWHVWAYPFYEVDDMHEKV